MDAERVVYDHEADVLYLWAEDPATVNEITTEETGDEILIKKNAETGTVIGMTVLHFSTRQDARTGIELPAAAV